MSIFVDHKMLKHLLKKLKDVLITSPADGHVLTYEAATKKWKNKAPTGAAHVDAQVSAVDLVSKATAGWALVPNMTITLTGLTVGQKVVILASLAAYHDTAGVLWYMKYYIDGVAVAETLRSFMNAAGYWVAVPLLWRDVITVAGNHTYEVWWARAAGTVYARERVLYVLVL